MTKNTSLPANQLPFIGDDNLDIILEAFKDYLAATFSCARIGIIQSFNPTNQRATIQLVDVLRRPTMQGVELLTVAPLINCPVILNYGTNGGFSFPIKPGMECEVFFNDKDISGWKATGAVQPPKTYRMHEITDAICIVGPKSNPNVIADYDNESVSMTYLDDSKTELGKIKVKDKIQISNDQASLQSLITQLINVLLALKVQNGAQQYSITSDTATGLNQLLTNFNKLLI